MREAYACARAIPRFGITYTHCSARARVEIVINGGDDDESVASSSEVSLMFSRILAVVRERGGVGMPARSSVVPLRQNFDATNVSYFCTT
jgi:hypothetical protein